MTPRSHNLFDNIPAKLEEELFEILAEAGDVQIERIVSDGHATKPGEWYEQDWQEWVLLVSGEAVLLFNDDTAQITLKPGDHVMIPAGCRHRVEQSDASQKTVWLAVHIGKN